MTTSLIGGYCVVFCKSLQPSMIKHNKADTSGVEYLDMSVPKVGSNSYSRLLQGNFAAILAHYLICSFKS